MSTIRDVSGARTGVGGGRSRNTRLSRLDWPWMVALFAGLAFVIEARVGGEDHLGPAQTFGGIILMGAALHLWLMVRSRAEVDKLADQTDKLAERLRALEARQEKSDVRDVRIARALKRVTGSSANGDRVA